MIPPGGRSFPVPHSIRRCLAALCLGGTLPVFGQTHLVEVRSILVGGGSQVHLVDPLRSEGEKPHLLRTWDAREVTDLPEEYRTRFFRSVENPRSQWSRPQGMKVYKARWYRQ